MSFGLAEDDTLIGYGYEEQCLMQVLWTSCVLMKRLQPKHWCNSVLQRLCKIDCNSVPLLKIALKGNDLNKRLKAANCPTFLCSTEEIISEALSPVMPGTNSHMQDFHFSRC